MYSCSNKCGAAEAFVRVAQSPVASDARASLVYLCALLVSLDALQGPVNVRKDSVSFILVYRGLCHAVIYGYPVA